MLSLISPGRMMFHEGGTMDKLKQFLASYAARFEDAANSGREWVDRGQVDPHLVRQELAWYKRQAANARRRLSEIS